MYNFRFFASLASLLSRSPKFGGAGSGPQGETQTIEQTKKDLRVLFGFTDITDKAD